MIIAFRSLFSSQYEGGANWLEVTIRCLGKLAAPPTCLVVDATTETLPSSLRDAPHVRAVPLGSPSVNRGKRIVNGLKRRISNESWEHPGLTQLANDYEIDLWVAFAWFADLGWHRRLLICYPDFQYRYFPELFDPASLREREQQWEFTAQHAAGILSISQATADDALKSDPQIAHKLHVCGFPPVFELADLRLAPDAVRQKYSLPERFFLVSNQFWEHKNHRLVLQALDHLKRQQHQPPVVVFTGRPYDHRRPAAFSELLQFVQERGLHDSCRFLGVMTREEQLALIRAAEAVIQPSKFEGRGAINEEASVLGTQLLCSDLPVHRELNLPNAIFFDPEDVEGLADLMQRNYPHSTKDAGTIAAESESSARTYGQNVMNIFAAVARANGQR